MITRLKRAFACLVRNDARVVFPDDTNPTAQTDEPPNEKIELHGTGTLSDGTDVGRRGGLWYVLDPEGRAVSKGYHELHVTYESETLIGKIGAVVETVGVQDE